MILAGMITHTSITDFLNMTIRQFYRVFVSICDVLEKRKHGGA